MKLKEFLCEKHLCYYSGLNPKDLENITIERVKEIENISKIYINFHYFHINNNPKNIILEKILENVVDYDTIYFEITEGFKMANQVQFNNKAEVLLFIILVLDPTYKMAKKYLQFTEQTNSNTKALIMHKQYAQKYNSFFEAKILQGELILLKREKELNNQNNPTKKRTISE